MRVKRVLVSIAVVLGSVAAGLVTTEASAFPPPGQCKKVRGECHGQSENAPPHCAEFPKGQQKNCS